MTNHHSAVDLLCRCLSVRVGPALSAQVGRHSPNDWNEVADMALRHGLGPLLFTRLKKSGARAGVPADAWQRLRLDYLTSAGANARLYRGLRAVLGGLRDAGIQVIVLKGAFLAEAVYGDIALRPMCDADLMVSRAEMPRAWAVLLDMGGVCQEHSHRATPASGAQGRDIESWCRKEPHLPAVGVRHVTLEVHWTIVPPTGPVMVDTAGLWDRARPASVAGVDVLALSTEDLLAHLCLHICYKHRLEAGLQSYYDIAETINRFRSEIDWMQVLDRAREWGVTRQVGLTLYLAGRMSGAEVPDGVLGQLIPGGLDQRILEMASESVAAQMLVPGRVSRSVRDLWSARSLGDRAQLVWERVFLSREEMAEKYPQSRNAKVLCFYYALRLRDVLDAHGASVPRMMLSRDVRQRASKMAAVTDWLESGKQ